MNSLILASLVSFFKAFGSAFQKSGIFAVINKIYTAVSGAWQKSGIIGVVGSDGRDGEAAKSFTGRILRLPFTFLEFIRKKAGAFLKKGIEESLICRCANTYVHNFMAVNTRFLGIMLLSASVIYSAAHIIGSGRISKLALLAAALGAVGAAVNYNLMSFLNPSKLVGFIKSAAGFRHLEFNFFDESETNGAARIIIAALAGVLTGAVMSVNIIAGAVIPFMIFGCLLVLIYPVTGVFAAVFLGPIVPTMLLAGICIWTGMALIVHSLTDRDFRWRFDGLGVVILLFLCVLFVASVFSFKPFGSLKVWAMYLVFAGFYFIIVNTIKIKKQIYGLFKIFVLSGALVALYGVMQYVFGWTTANAWIDETMFENDVMRVYSTLANPNVLGEYLLLVLPVAAVFALKDKYSHLSKWAYLAMFGLLGLCLVLTQSRGCWIGFMLSVFVFVCFYEGRWWGLIPIVLLILPMAVPETVVDRIASVGNMEDSSTSYRVYIWMGTFGMLKHYWPGGIGMGEQAFAQVYPFFMYNAVTAPHSHNTYLQLLVESGIAGLGVFLVMQIVFAMKMHTLYKMDYKKNTDSAMALALSSGVIGFLAQSMFDYTFYNYRVMAIFFMVMAMGIVLKNIKSGEEAHS